jgi:hypothetical protein
MPTDQGVPAGDRPSPGAPDDRRKMNKTISTGEHRAMDHAQALGRIAAPIIGPSTRLAAARSARRRQLLEPLDDRGHGVAEGPVVVARAGGPHHSGEPGLEILEGR